MFPLALRSAARESTGLEAMKNLKAIRRAAGMTQMQLIQKAGLSRFRFCMAEAGHLELRPDEIDAIRIALRPEMEKAVRIAAGFVAVGA